MNSQHPAHMGRTESPELSLVRSAIGLANVAASASWKLTFWAADTALQASRQAIEVAMESDAPQRIASAAVVDLRLIADQARAAVRAVDAPGAASVTDAGIFESDVEPAGPEIPEDPRPRDAEVEHRRPAPHDLRARGDELLERSADVRREDGLHPAYERILDELAPDEARVLRLLTVQGAQPTVDVRTNRPFGIGSEKVAQGLSMIGELAGCRHVDRIHSYLNNLHRLGLVWFSREQVALDRYQVVEVQPAVVDALRRAGRSPRIVRRSIHLTSFGEDFCRTCFTAPAR